MYNIYIYIYRLGASNKAVLYHVPKCIRCHKAIAMITWRAHCFHDYIYVTPILSCFCDI